MDFTVWNEKDKLFVKLTGEIDHHAVTSVRGEIDTLILKKRPSTLVMNLEDIDFMDSSGLGFVLGRMRHMNDIKGELIVVNPAKRVVEMLCLAGADKLVKIVYSNEDAI